MKLTAKEWHDVADLCDQGAVYADAQESETHKPKARKVAAKWMERLAMLATDKAFKAEQREKIKQILKNT